jgi:hypothetical protein
MRNESRTGARHPGRDQSERPAGINRNRWPQSLRNARPKSSESAPKRHLKARAGLFPQVLKLCRAAGLVKLGHVALDGTKIKANASRHKAMSYGRMKQTEQRLAAEVQAWLARAAAADAAEDQNARSAATT